MQPGGFDIAISIAKAATDPATADAYTHRPQYRGAA